MLSHKHKYIFLHIPKTASVSFRSVLPDVDLDFRMDNNGINQMLDIPHHVELDGRGRAVRKRLGEEKWNSYYKFSFVRNPWDRAVSAWKMLDKESTFTDFVYKIPGYLHDKGKSYNHERWHVWPQHIHTVDFNNKSLLDFIGRFENLQQDFEIVCSHLGLAVSQLPHHNKTQHKNYTDYYDDNTRNLIAKIYKKDIKHFEYTFHGYKNNRIGE